MKTQLALNSALSSALILVSTFSAVPSFAAPRTFVVPEKEIQISLDAVQGQSNLYYLQVDHVEADEAGRTMVVKKPLSGGNQNQEDFAYPKLDFFVRLGGTSANAKSKPPIAGFFTFNGRDYKLSNQPRPMNLAKSYAETECLSAPDKATAEKAHVDGLAQVKAACGFSPKLIVDWASFDGAGKTALACNAREALLGFADVCKDADFKQAAAAFKTVSVKYGSGDAFKKSAGSFTYTVPSFPENTRFRAKVFLQDNL